LMVQARREPEPESEGSPRLSPVLWLLHQGREWRAGHGPPTVTRIERDFAQPALWIAHHTSEAPGGEGDAARMGRSFFRVLLISRDGDYLAASRGEFDRIEIDALTGWLSEKLEIPTVEMPSSVWPADVRRPGIADRPWCNAAGRRGDPVRGRCQLRAREGRPRWCQLAVEHDVLLTSVGYFTRWDMRSFVGWLARGLEIAYEPA
jgi:hypothetical protein